MSMWSDLRLRLAALFRGSALDRDSEEELRHHLELETRRLTAAGLAPEEAGRRARVALGGVTPTMEEVRSARGARWINDLGRDLRYAVRQLRRTPSFTIVALLTLALGIGANAAIFSVVNGVLLRPAPFKDASRLVSVWETDRNTGTTREPSSWPDYVDFARQGGRSLAALAAVAGAQITYTPAEGEPARLTAVAATASVFGLLGIDPLRGRAFTAEEDRPGAQPVVLLGQAFWRSRFAGRQDIIGRTIRLDDIEYGIIGVMPHGADFGLDQLHAHAAYHGAWSAPGEVDIWIPLRASEASFPRDNHPFFVLGRLAPGASLASAQEQFTAIAAGLERQYPSNRARGVFLETLDDVVFASVRPVLFVLLGAVALVLLVTCVNVANLLLARGAARLREVALRGALGADAARIGRQFLTESVLLALLGGAAGTVLAFVGLRGLLALAPADTPRLAEVGLDRTVLGVTLGLSVLVGVVFGLVPTLQARKFDVMGILKNETPSPSAHRSRFRSFLVAGELALSVTLVVSAGLLIRSFAALLGVNPGFEVARVVKAQFQLPRSRYPTDYSKYPAWTEIQQFNARVLAATRALPGVESAALASAHPLDPGFTNSFTIVGREAESHDWPEISNRIVSPGYFATMGLRLVTGRFLEESDAVDAPTVAVINQTAAKRFFAGGDPLGHELRFWGINRRIVGVVADERIHGLIEAVPPAAYLSLYQAPSSGALLVKARGRPEDLVPEVRRAIWSVDPALAVYGVEPLRETLVDSIGQRRFAMLVLGAFAAMTLVLALVGIHGVLSYATSQRTREIGIRVALGASRAGVAGLVVRNGLRLAAVGTALGLLGAWAGGRLLGGLLYGVGRADPLTFVVVPVVVLAGALLAVWMPARRAVRVEPIEALRAE